MDYQDRIGQRLDDPESVPAEYRHLIPDDVQRVERILGIPVSGRVLDVGCSDGAITRRIAGRWDADTIGVDLEPQVQYAGEHYHPKAPLIQAWDIRQWREEWTRFFDAVYACEVFEHLTDADAEKALANILNVLKPGGDLIVTVPNRYPADLYEVGCRARWAWPDHRSAWTYHKLFYWLRPYFHGTAFQRLYDHDVHPQESIWLICHAKGKL